MKVCILYFGWGIIICMFWLIFGRILFYYKFNSSVYWYISVSSMIGAIWTPHDCEGCLMIVSKLITIVRRDYEQGRQLWTVNWPFSHDLLMTVRRCSWSWPSCSWSWGAQVILWWLHLLDLNGSHLLLWSKLSSL